MADISKRYKLKWSELTPEQKKKSGSRAAHSAKRKELDQKSNKSSSSGSSSSSSGSSSSSAGSSSSSSGSSSSSSSGSADISKRYTKKWSELSDTQKEKSGSRSAHRTRRDELNARANDNHLTRKELKAEIKKGTSLRDINQLNKSDATRGAKAQRFLDKKIKQRKEKIYGVNDLEDFDTTAGGIGSNNNRDKISKYDLKKLEEAGHSREDIVAMVESKDEKVSNGNRAQKLLNKWKDEFTNKPAPEPEPVEPTPTPTDPVEPTPTPTNPTPTPTNPAPTPTNPTPTPTNPAPTPTNPAPTPTNPTPTPVTPTPTPTQPPTTDIDTGDVDQEIDQDITNEDVNNTDIDDSFDGGTIGDIDNETNIVGDNNVVDNSVDNSNNSRYYGGNNTVWNIQKGNQDANTGFRLGGGNYTGGVDTTLSDLTTLGYGKPDDSPAANAKFVDMYQTMNSDAQEKYKDFGEDTANKYIRMARANNPVDFAGIQRTLSGYKNEEGEIVPGTAQDFFNRALERQTMFMGDYANFPIPNYTMPMPPDPIDDDLDVD